MTLRDEVIAMSVTPCVTRDLVPPFQSDYVQCRQRQLSVSACSRLVPCSRTISVHSHSVLCSLTKGMNLHSGRKSRWYGVALCVLGWPRNVCFTNFWALVKQLILDLFTPYNSPYTGKCQITWTLDGTVK